MRLRLISKTISQMVVMAAVFTALSGDAFAHGWWGGDDGGWGGWGGNDGSCGCGGGGGGGSVPEIGAGSAASALTLLSGCAYLLKDRLWGTRTEKSSE